MFVSARSRCRSRPLSPGMRTSSIKQEGTSGRVLCRKSWADANVSTLSPTDLMRLFSASRIDSSSSITNTISAALFVMIRRQGELEDRSLRRVRCGPKATAMRLDDGPAYGQTHAHAFRLGRVERIEHALEVRCIKSLAGIAHRDDYVLLIHVGAD